MDKAIAVNPRHLWIDLRDDGASTLGGCLCAFHSNAQAAVAMRIGRGHLDEADIDGQLSRHKERRDLREEDRGEIRSSRVDCFRDMRANKEGVVAEVRLHLRENVVCVSKG